MKIDYLVIGSGIAGLNFALQASQKGKVLVVTKKRAVNSNTNYAQGGIAGVLKKTDKIQSHIDDTLKAGSHHNNKKAVSFMVKNSRQAIKNLIDYGVNFNSEKGKLKLTKEGGHSTNRIAYVGDYTGQAIEKALIKNVKNTSSITIWENTFALDLIIAQGKCLGVKVIKEQKLISIFAPNVILATGGIGQLFKYSTNPAIATADGLAMGLRANCQTADLEFIQFHPTALAKKSSPKFLLSEALRGEGAKIVNEKGKRIMENTHPQKELAPRDIVAKQIYLAQKKGPVYLDMRDHQAQTLKERFPQISKKLQEYNLNLAQDFIPITPAAHYLCGGITTDLKGKTNIQNLYAFGEISHTGVHGANRLASNSLLEALVFSSQILKSIPKENKEKSKIVTKKINYQNLEKEKKLCQQARKKIRNLMWNYCGIIRNQEQIKKVALPKIKDLIKKLSQTKNLHPYIIETKNMAQSSKAILTSASKRNSTLGCHIIDL